MKSENIINALNDIDPELVTDAEEVHRKSSNAVFQKWGAAAAVLCLISAFAFGYFLSDSQQPILESKPGVSTSISSTPTPTTSIPKPTIPIFKDALYTAAEIADFWGNTDTQGGTSSYKEVYVPSLAHLQPHGRLDSPFWTLYQYEIPKNELSTQGFHDFLDTKLSRIASELGVAVPSYMVKDTSIGYTDRDLTADIFNMDGYALFANHNAIFNMICFYATPSIPSREIVLGDVRIEVDQTKSDEQIISSLSEIKEKLFYLFGVEFSDIKVNRIYTEYGEHGATWLNVYFYNEADHPLNAVMDVPYSNYISLEFDNHKGSDSDIVSNTVLLDVTIRYRQLRTSATRVYPATMRAPSISLQEAEALLYNGYVFGGHSCPVCMAQQNAVDFSDYDFVDIVYIKETTDRGKPAALIPFYAFYKKIGIAENGNEIYAKTYVPAIRVSGYEEYFKSQESQHKDE